MDRRDVAALGAGQQPTTVTAGAGVPVPTTAAPSRYPWQLVGLLWMVAFLNNADRAVIVAVETIVNLLAPSQADRFFETSSGPQSLRYSGALPGPVLHMQDGWQKIRVTLHAPGSENFWIAPIETVSESEDGFERVYQGSQILARWRLSTQKVLSARVVWRLETI